MLVAYLQDTSLSVVVGKSGVPVTVDGHYQLDGLRGIVRDGVIIDPEAFKARVEQFWKSNELETKNIKVVIKSKRVTVRTMEVPVFKKDRDLRAYMDREVQTQSRFTDACFAYRTVGKGENNTNRMLVTIADRALIERTVTVFKQLGITVAGIATPYTTVISAAEAMKGDHKDKTVLFLTADHDQSDVVLFQDSQYRYSSEQHLFTEYGTPDFGSEMLRSATGIEQFMQAEEISDGFSRICLLGFTNEAAQVVADALYGYDPSLAITEVKEYEIFDANTNVEPDFVEKCLPAVLGLINYDNGTKLVDSFLNKIGEGKNTDAKNDLLGALKIPLICLAASLVIVAGLFAWNAVTKSQVDGIKNSLMNTAALKQISAYNEAKAANDTAQAAATSAEQLAAGEATFPVPGSQIEATIAACAIGLVDYQTLSYSESTGQYIIQATATDNENIDDFVERLLTTGASTGAFTVSNNGYAYQQTTTSNPNVTQGDWTLDVTLTLAAGEGR